MKTNQKEKERSTRGMDKHMTQIAKIHLRNGGQTSPDWIFHQTVRFIFDGYAHCAGPLFKRLQMLEGGSLRVRGLRLILQSEAQQPTPLGNLCPSKVGSNKARQKLLKQINNQPQNNAN